MEVAKTRNTRVTCKPQELETFWFKSAAETGNSPLARDMGIHPTGLSREKSRIVKLASRLVAKYGIPEWAIEMPDHKQMVVIEGEHAERLIQALECKGKVKRKTPVVDATEASEMQLEMSI
ncbi:hypothetical protein [Xenorhabdus bovienii]|uniref:hypothetical protein n=1 Tax=Xenorhabdus bovienii TaxID=40576 RepID=UPI0004D3C3F4|nr:hypothetical protein [Xenorhabdus bovienii]CDG90105.1 hypothetical protein XBFFR1_600004 [Xenorhabdus bovienii str. feltiae France]CDG91687.1 hypothetical protein XBFFL1_1700005 [Xenorhabdus bovienii str. feltiae Florida]